ncbi:MAG: Gfo/Idh/MocA family oxidoreductase [Polyangiaceae bacterium]
MLKVGVVGLGVGEKHAEAFLHNPHCEVVALCDHSQEKALEVRSRLGCDGARIVRHADELLSAPDIDVVAIATFDDDHAEQVELAWNHGKHVFVEKPLCMHTTELDRLWALHLERPTLQLSSNLILRMSPRFRELRDWIRNGRLGRLYYLEGDYDYGRLHKITEGWRGKLPFYSITHGGGVHVIDLLMWLAGERIVEVEAMGNAIASAGSGFRFQDCVIAIARGERGTLFKVTSNFACVKPHFHRVSVYGTLGTFENGWPDGRLYESRDPAVAPQAISTPYPGTHKGDLIASFVDQVLGRGVAEVSLEDVFSSMRVALAVERAKDLNTSISIVF